MKILIIEDEEKIALSLKKNFIKEGYNVTVVFNAESGLDEIKKNEFSIILLDWKLPNLTGLDFCRIIRKNGNNTPVILLTAMNDIQSKVIALEAGADDYVTKPFSFDELNARINAVIRRVKTSNTKIQFGNFYLNLIERTVDNQDKQIKLSEREFDLLRYLILNKGTIISKEKICKDVWNLNFTLTTNVIEVTIKNLRKKLEEETNKNFIKTIYGEGYLFLDD